MSLRKFKAVLAHVQETSILELTEHGQFQQVDLKRGKAAPRRAPR